MFLDQITTQDSFMLNNFNVITRKSFNEYHIAQKIPQWFKTVENTIIDIQNGQRLIKQQFHMAPSSHMKGAIIPTIQINNRKQEFVAFYNPTILAPLIG